VVDTAHSEQQGGGAPQAEGTPPSAVFIVLKSIPQRSYARDLRLRDGDVIAAIDSIAFHGDILEFENMLIAARDSDTEIFVTIARDDICFEIFMGRPLGATFDYTDTFRANALSERLATYHIGPKAQYKTYEAMRNVHRHVALHNTSYSGLATVFPPLWLLQHRALEPLAAVVAAYAAAAAVHWAAFIVTVFLIGAYFHRIQFRILRNYNLFTEHYYWVVCAARSTADAQKICRDIDPKCTFSFSYVGPPQDGEADATKSSKRRAAKS